MEMKGEHLKICHQGKKPLPQYTADRWTHVPTTAAPAQTHRAAPPMPAKAASSSEGNADAASNSDFTL